MQSALTSFSIIPDVAYVTINVDGLPLGKSCKDQLWPILGSVKADIRSKPFVIGIYCGVTKPHNSNEFLQMFVDEGTALEQNGLPFLSRVVQVKFGPFVCDLPARCFIKQVNYHTAYNSCQYCTCEGEFISSVVFLENDCSLRTDASFRQQLDEEHHMGETNLVQYPA